MTRFLFAALAALIVSPSFAADAKITLQCTEQEPGHGYPAVVNIFEKDGKKFGAVYPHSYADTAEPLETEITRIDENGPEIYYFGKDFELRYDPTVEEATFFENSVTQQIELFCEPR